MLIIISFLYSRYCHSHPYTFLLFYNNNDNNATRKPATYFILFWCNTKYMSFLLPAILKPRDMRILSRVCFAEESLGEKCMHAYVASRFSFFFQSHSACKLYGKKWCTCRSDTKELPVFFWWCIVVVLLVSSWFPVYFFIHPATYIHISLRQMDVYVWNMQRERERERARKCLLWFSPRKQK